MLQLGRHAVRGNGGFIVAGPLGFALVPADLADSAQRVVTDTNEDLTTWVNSATASGLPFAHMDLRGPVPLLSLGGSANVRAIAPGYDTPFTWGGPLSMWEFVPGEWTLMDIALSEFDDAQPWAHFATSEAEASQVRIGYPVEPELPSAPALVEEEKPAQVQEEHVEDAPSAEESAPAPEPEASHTVWGVLEEEPQPQEEAAEPQATEEPAPKYLWAPEPEAEASASEETPDIYAAGAQVAAAQAAVTPTAAPVYTSPEALEETITSEAFAAMQQAASQDAPQNTAEPQASVELDAPSGEQIFEPNAFVEEEASIEVPADEPAEVEAQVSQEPVEQESQPEAEESAPASEIEETPAHGETPAAETPAAGVAPAFEIDNSDSGATVLRRVTDDSQHTQAGYLVYAGAAPVELTHDVILGRDPNARVLTGRPSATVMRVPSPANEISRSHAAVIPSGFGSWMLMDLGSANGTLLRSSNGNVQEVPPRVTVPLSDGDVIDLGENVLVEFIVR
ncbi:MULTISPECIES: FHA domain-containing protein [unclassified Actinomyces]|jgi:putative FHA domain protein|uniref:FHA domain-containing protein n=1 Tax=unclassified Actinomyces TaxID=2609248 RepID=UPI00031CB61F|nr:MULTISPECIES: FHA domain-containing protein [unclassified Actinomyces]MDU2259703.1 FHA domain-containing protein [Actinomyces sp.]